MEYRRLLSGITDGSLPMKNFASSPVVTDLSTLHRLHGTHPQGNGLAEHTVQTIKDILKKTAVTREDPHLALLAYRTTPLSSTGITPAQLLIGRRLRNTLPSAPGHLQPVTIYRDAVVSRDIQSKPDQASTYNRHRGVRTLPQLLPGDHVLVWNADQKQWRTPGQVKRQISGRSYQAVLPGGSVI